MELSGRLSVKVTSLWLGGPGGTGAQLPKVISGHTGRLWSREAEAAQIMLKLPYMMVAACNGHVDFCYFKLAGRSGTNTHGGFHSIYNKVFF